MLFLLGFLMADFPAGLLGGGFGLGLAFFGIGIMSAADFGHGVLRWGYGGLVVFGKVCDWVWERKGWILGTGCYSVEDCVEWGKGSIYYME